MNSILLAGIVSRSARSPGVAPSSETRADDGGEPGPTAPSRVVRSQRLLYRRITSRALWPSYSASWARMMTLELPSVGPVGAPVRPERVAGRLRVTIALGSTSRLQGPTMVGGGVALAIKTNRPVAFGPAAPTMARYSPSSGAVKVMRAPQPPPLSSSLSSDAKPGPVTNR